MAAVFTAEPVSWQMTQGGTIRESWLVEDSQTAK